jgi:hypothetical protein
MKRRLRDSRCGLLAKLDAPIPVANTDARLKGNANYLFAEPEGIDFDAPGNLWIANKNDGAAGGVQNPRTSLVQITPRLQAAVLATAPGGTMTPTAAQSNTDFFIYQVPNLTEDDVGARPQFGGLQVDRAAGRIFVNEENAGNGRGMRSGHWATRSFEPQVHSPRPVRSSAASRPSPEQLRQEVR